jgi:hypothetical protein
MKVNHPFPVLRADYNYGVKQLFIPSIAKKSAMGLPIPDL